MPNGLVILFWGLLGTAVGSFLNVVADRLPAKGSLLSPPSYCPVCQHRLGAAELVPVWSYLIQHGRCRVCSAPIGLRSPLVELGTGLLFALTAGKMLPAAPEEWLTFFLTTAYLAILIVVAITDLEHGLILNRVIHPAIGLALVGALLAGWPGLLSYLAGGLLGAGLIALIIFLVPGGMGWGDARLAGFIGLITGLSGILFVFFLSFVSGGVVAAVLLLTGRSKRGDTIPFGPFLVLGGGVVLLYQDTLLRIFHTLAASL